MIDSESLGRLEKALTHLYGQDNLTSNGIVRILADLRHLCRPEGHSFSALDQAAQKHYLADKGTAWTAEDILRNEG